jgi:hypothetical protein
MRIYWDQILVDTSDGKVPKQPRRRSILNKRTFAGVAFRMRLARMGVSHFCGD